jgi:hypothetical protein
VGSDEVSTEERFPNWNIYALLADGKPYFVGETRRTPEARLREQARAGRRIVGEHDFVVITPKGGPQYLALAQSVAMYTAKKLSILP